MSSEKELLGCVLWTLLTQVTRTPVHLFTCHLQCVCLKSALHILCARCKKNTRHPWRPHKRCARAYQRDLCHPTSPCTQPQKHMCCMQVGVFSATLPPEALEITRKFMNKPVSEAVLCSAHLCAWCLRFCTIVLPICVHLFCPSCVFAHPIVRPPVYLCCSLFDWPGSVSARNVAGCKRPGRAL